MTKPVVMFGVALLWLVWFCCWLLISTERYSLERDSARDTSNLAIVFEQNVVRWLGEAERIINFLRDADIDRASAPDWSASIGKRHLTDEQTLQVTVTDADGRVIANSSGLKKDKPIDLSDREHFYVHKNALTDELFISRPVLGRISGKWSIQVTRRYSNQAGGFGGVIIISLESGLIARLYGDIHLGRRSGLALVGEDHIIRSATGDYANRIGELLSLVAMRSVPYEPGRFNNLYLYRTGDQLRLNSLRKLSQFPLTIVVTGRDFNDDPEYLARKWRYLTGSTALSIIIVLAVMATLRNRKLYEKQVNYLARHDPVTDLANRATFRVGLDNAVSKAALGHGFALHLIDLDRFKFVNDSFGHPVGDKLLKEVASRLQATLRQGDLIARLGGDEFAVLQMDVSCEERAGTLAKRICDALCQIYEIDGLRIDISASVGVALAPRDARTGCDIMVAADLALYAAKSDGRSCFRFFHEKLFAAAQARKAIEADLKAAIQFEQLEVHYQPILNINTSQVTCYEALVRWRHPERGMIPPADFIPLAEETGLIIPIGEWVLNKACSDMAQMDENVKVAVNLSPIQFKSPALVETVKQALRSSELSPKRLKVEITESTLMRKDSLTIQLLQDIKALGVDIAMDDFGTGYSSLSYLQSYPINCIKIDRSFVSTLDKDGQGSAIVRAITTLANSLGMSTIAEGVETQAQLDELKRVGCCEAQGFLFSRPRPVCEILHDLAEANRTRLQNAA